MNIKERIETIQDIDKQIEFEQKALTKKILRYFKGIKPTVEHDEYGLTIFVYSDVDGIIANVIPVYVLDSTNVHYEDCISEELSNKIKNDYVECYGEIKEPEAIPHPCLNGLMEDMHDSISYSLIGIDFSKNRKTFSK